MNITLPPLPNGAYVMATYKSGYRTEMTVFSGSETTAYATAAVELDRLSSGIPRWVLVKDRLPPPNSGVITLSKKKISSTGYAVGFDVVEADEDDETKHDERSAAKFRLLSYWLEFFEYPANPFVGTNK